MYHNQLETYQFGGRTGIKPYLEEAIRPDSPDAATFTASVDGEPEIPKHRLAVFTIGPAACVRMKVGASFG